MNEINDFKENEFDKETEVNLSLLFNELLKKAWAIVLAAVIFAGAAFTVTNVFIKPTYVSTFTAYINNRSDYSTVNNGSLTSSDISASRALGTTYSKIILSHAVLDAACEQLDGVTYSDVAGAVTTQIEEDDEILTVIVETTDAKKSYEIANAITEVAPDIASQIVEGSSMQYIDKPQLATSIYAPNYKKNAVIGFVFGAFVAAAFFTLKFIFDDRIKDESELESTFNIPVVGVIPDVNSIQDDDYYLYSRSKSKKGVKKNGKEK